MVRDSRFQKSELNEGGSAHLTLAFLGFLYQQNSPLCWSTGVIAKGILHTEQAAVWDRQDPTNQYLGRQGDAAAWKQPF